MKMTRIVAALLACLCAAGPAMAQEANSWLHINQQMQQMADWQRIVENSRFQIPALTERYSARDGDGAGIREIAFGTYPSLDGSTVAVPMAVEFARQHLGLAEQDRASFVFFTTTHSAYEHLILRKPNAAAQIPSVSGVMDQGHPVDLILVTEPSDEETEMAKQYGVELIIKPVCLDAFVFITHRDNPVESLTIEEIRAIYAAEITNWKAIGGDDLRIIPYQREKNSGSQTAMEKLVMNGMPISAVSKKYTIVGMGTLVETVGDYQTSPGSIGYTYQYYIDTLYKNENIKVLSVDGISPTPENLQTGKYPFTTAYYGVIRGGEEAQPGGLFLDWMLSDEGQRCIEQAGYIPVRAVSGL